MTLRTKLAGVAGAAVIALASAGSASANCGPGCDGPTDWSGFWFAAGIGAKTAKINYSTVETNPATGAVTWSDEREGFGATGFLGTIGLGYDAQVSDRIVLGIFADIDFTNTDYTYRGRSAAARSSVDFEIDRTWSIGGKLGIATSNTAMIYGLVGYTQASFEGHDVSTTRISPQDYKKSMDLSGYMLGVGFDQALGGGFSIRGEYRYADYSEDTFFNGRVVTGAGTINELDEIDVSTHDFRVTLAYKLGRAERPVSYKDMPPAYGRRPVPLK